MIGIGIFDALQQGLTAGLASQTAVVLVLGVVMLAALFMMAYDPLLGMIFAATPFVLLAAEAQPSYGVVPIAVIVMGLAIALGIGRLFMRL